MVWRGEVEDGSGWGGLLPTREERRQEMEGAKKDAEIERLRAEVAELKKDAKRYRWLRDHQTEDGFVVTWQSEDVAAGEQLDKLVDAALGGED